MFFLWEYVEVSWRGNWWAAEIVSENNSEQPADLYDIIYLGTWKCNHETSVYVKRIRKSKAAIPSKETIAAFTPETQIRIALH